MTMTDSATRASEEQDLDALLVRAAVGDCDAFGEFYDATAPQIYAVLLSMTGVASTADTLLENIYVEAWERMRGRSAPPCPGREWMSSIAHRHATAHL
ncbi:hypothetical protein MTE01_00500 [Microbacterium testaceum]|uniref:RNA polymerase sigma-70 region 2 domain-containing protein n=2 Tax=Microbacterium testaceum TaxID=2033 RepID=A0A4Y3QG70_MICTE|nr:hypothetical protein [Microbacterium testaceum]WJS91462.1 hypothetical protein NYQ11_02605 [Microbacterium testaceum]GEB44105.1 hypothetical protein MTE01_00500 [Microbacterium testaceum]